ncbi:MAG: acyclic terpene utilization AtuA family protein, partial [Planctomycetales bacterium]|nr:acyclic terpene utilization AtuA family protein [Planctomycetales bacterium]
GDSLAAPVRLLEQTNVDYLTLEYLAELTMSILAAQRRQDPERGYAHDFVTVMADITRFLKSQPNLRIVTNAGGLHPQACARAVADQLCAAGLAKLAVGVVAGDDLLPRIAELQQQGARLKNLDTGQPLSDVPAEIVAANAYLGAAPIKQALDAGARVVITGRVADASLTVAPAVAHYDWSWQDWDRLAAASVAGHVIECGAQATGGYTTDWRHYSLANIGYPIAEIDEKGETIITKPPASGGAVNRHTVAEQLVYEIGDPSRYLTPDVEVDLTNVELAELANDRVAVRGAQGRPPPDQYKVSLAIADGYAATGQLLVYGEDCIVKARVVAELIFQQLKGAGVQPQQTYTELLGAGDGVPGLHPPPEHLR